MKKNFNKDAKLSQIKSGKKITLKKNNIEGHANINIPKLVKNDDRTVKIWIAQCHLDDLVCLRAFFLMQIYIKERRNSRITSLIVSCFYGNTDNIGKILGDLIDNAEDLSTATSQYRIQKYFLCSLPFDVCMT